MNIVQRNVDILSAVREPDHLSAPVQERQGAKPATGLDLGTHHGADLQTVHCVEARQTLAIHGSDAEPCVQIVQAVAALEAALAHEGLGRRQQGRLKIDGVRFAQQLLPRQDGLGRGRDRRKSGHDAGKRQHEDRDDLQKAGAT